MIRQSVYAAWKTAETRMMTVSREFVIKSRSFTRSCIVDSQDESLIKGPMTISEKLRAKLLTQVSNAGP